MSNFNSVAPLPFTYADLVDVDDLDPLAAETTSDLQALTQDVLHLLEELPGSNLDDPNRGIGIMLYLSGTSQNLSTLPALIETQLNADSRISGAAVTITAQKDLTTYDITVQVQVADSVLGLQFQFSSSAGLVLSSAGLVS